MQFDGRVPFRKSWASSRRRPLQDFENRPRRRPQRTRAMCWRPWFGSNVEGRLCEAARSIICARYTVAGGRRTCRASSRLRNCISTCIASRKPSTWRGAGPSKLGFLRRRAQPHSGLGPSAQRQEYAQAAYHLDRCDLDARSALDRPHPGVPSAPGQSRCRQRYRRNDSTAWKTPARTLFALEKEVDATGRKLPRQIFDAMEGTSPKDQRAAAKAASINRFLCCRARSGRAQARRTDSNALDQGSAGSEDLDVRRPLVHVRLARAWRKATARRPSPTRTGGRSKLQVTG